MHWLEKVKKYQHVWFYVGMVMVILNGFFFSGFLSMVISMGGIALVLYGFDDEES